MKETAYHFCVLCDRWIRGSFKQITDPVTSSGCFLVTENTPRGQIAHSLLTKRRLAQKKFRNPPPDLQPEPESIVVQPKSEPEIIPPSPVPEAIVTLAQPPEPVWEPDESMFYEVEIIRHNNVGSTGTLSNGNRVFVHNHVAKNSDYPPGSTLWVRLRAAGPDAMYDYRALEIWKETPELEPVGSATLADIFKEKL